MMDRKLDAIDRTGGSIVRATHDAGSLIKRGLADLKESANIINAPAGDGNTPLYEAAWQNVAPDVADVAELDVAELRPIAERGDARAQTELGFRYVTSRGVQRDDAEAVRWFRRAAEQGDARGQNNLGFMYENGRGVQRDDAEAVRWFRRAAEQGDARGQNNVRRVGAHRRPVPALGDITNASPANAHPIPPPDRRQSPTGVATLGGKHRRSPCFPPPGVPPVLQDQNTQSKSRTMGCSP